MADIQNINAIINGKRRHIAEILHSNRKRFLRMHSANVADNGRKCGYVLNF